MITELSEAISTSHINDFYLAQVVLVLACAGLIGFERQRRDKPVGMRTSILIALGTMMFVKSGLMIMEEYSMATADPTRVLGQVVTGIGFLGAGSIITREGLVKGLTTAASIWVTAAIGVLIAFGFLLDAIIFTLVTVIVLYGISHLEIRFQKLFRRRRRKNTTEE